MARFTNAETALGPRQVKWFLKLDFVHLGGAGEDVCELSVNCGWGFQLSEFNPDSGIFQ